ncbi:MAG: hypothetical protein ACRC0V_08425, partial [Fusobacteriaceae bacterium]
ELKECKEAIKKEYEEIKTKGTSIERYFDVFVDADNRKIYYAIGNDKKKQLYDKCYSIISQMRLVKSYLKGEALIEKFDSFLYENSISEDSGRISKYKHVSKQEGIDFGNASEEKVPSSIKALWDNPKNEKGYIYAEKSEFDRVLGNVKNFYANFYVYNNIANIYDKSLFAKTTKEKK